MRASPLPAGAPPGATRGVIRRVDDEVEMVDLRWGLHRDLAGESGQRFVRSEGSDVRELRCLVPASEFQVVRNGKAYRVSLDDGNWFYLAGVWRPQTAGWPEAFAILTIPANPDVARYQDRQGATILRHRRMMWLDGGSEEELLRPLPRGSLRVTAAQPVRQLGLPI